MKRMDRQHVVLTGEEEALRALEQKIKVSKLDVYVLPTIAFEKCTLNDSEQESLHQLSSYDYLFFSSVRAVQYFVEALVEYHIDGTNIEVPVVAVGPVTANACTQAGLRVVKTPSRFTAGDMISELPQLRGKKILFPRSSIAPEDTLVSINNRGAEVMPLLLYKTVYRNQALTEADQSALATAQVIVFLSPSSIKSFVKLVDGSTLTYVLETMTALCIGPRTARAADALGFKNVTTAETYTTNGVMHTLTKLI